MARKEETNWVHLLEQSHNLKVENKKKSAPFCFQVLTQSISFSWCQKMAFLLFYGGLLSLRSCSGFSPTQAHRSFLNHATAISDSSSSHFEVLGLSKSLARAAEKCGYTLPSAIQVITFINNNPQFQIIYLSLIFYLNLSLFLIVFYSHIYLHL